MTIFEALRADHRKQRTLLDILVKTEGDSEGREEIFDRLKAQLKAHAGAEEEHFYALLMKHDLTRDKARHSVAEHQDIDECIEALEDTDFSSSAWLVKAKKLKELVEHHLDEEEHEVFQLAGKALTEAQKERRAPQYEREMERLLQQQDA